MSFRIETDYSRRLVADRRSGVDLRTAEQKHAQGERRQGDRRRTKPVRRQRGIVWLLVAALCLIAVDMKYFGGRHTQEPLFEAAAAANALANRFVSTPFSR